MDQINTVRPITSWEVAFGMANRTWLASTSSACPAAAWNDGNSSLDLISGKNITR